MANAVETNGDSPESSKAVQHMNDIEAPQIAATTVGVGSTERRASKKNQVSDAVARSQSQRNKEYFNNTFGSSRTTENAEAATPKGVIQLELKTNVILDQEFAMAKLLSSLAAKRYNTVETHVAVVINHSQCLMMGGTYDGCYLLTITGITNMQPTQNKRNLTLIQEWLHQNLGVSPSRGYVRFVEADPANFGTSGVTFISEMEQRDVQRSLTGRKSTRKKNPPRTSEGDRPREEVLAAVAGNTKKLSRQKSMFNIFRRGEKDNKSDKTLPKSPDRNEKK